ncbi:porin family protein [Vibrio sp. SCSIO 43140]|uniref:porin family protein n=1 Tax=Vibrio sp. SCSIO 43140 TaxID=2819100 RepID=UPI0020759C1B|nr:porin family protein [Vibrio sp. SCSIO 43140]USD58798.1 porin family protein [Vibrio sp. SCSIO 43140]USD59132.1 porin family protein [Vibrio sp. SCSIO 43140]USD59715.1 porin family protein [Vibrio sp. SCSIO 43140]
MKKLAVAAILAAGISAPTLAQDGKGFRAEIGFSSNWYDEFGYESDSESGFVLRGGYDFNKIVGVSLSYEKVGPWSENYGSSTSEIEVSRFGAQVEVGYDFQNAGFAIKPYIGFGLANTKAEGTFTDVYCVNWNCYRSEYTAKNSETSATGAFGVRMTFNEIMTFGYEAKAQEFSDVDLYTHQLLVGLKF